MLPAKGYFRTLECPYYVLANDCNRPFCHFKHPRRDINNDVLEFCKGQTPCYEPSPVDVNFPTKSPADENESISTNQKVKPESQNSVLHSANSSNHLSSSTVKNDVCSAQKDKEPLIRKNSSSSVSTPVLKPHIPIVSVPSKPVASILKKKSLKSDDVSKSNSKLCSRDSRLQDSKPVPFSPSFDYDPVPVEVGGTKTYSRYSYEKAHDSGDEIMENYKTIIDKKVVNSEQVDSETEDSSQSEGDFSYQPGSSKKVSKDYESTNNGKSKNSNTKDKPVGNSCKRKYSNEKGYFTSDSNDEVIPHVKRIKSLDSKHSKKENLKRKLTETVGSSSESSNEFTSDIKKPKLKINESKNHKSHKRSQDKDRKNCHHSDKDKSKSSTKSKVTEKRDKNKSDNENNNSKSKHLNEKNDSIKLSVKKSGSHKSGSSSNKTSSSSSNKNSSSKKNNEKSDSCRAPESYRDKTFHSKAITEKVSSSKKEQEPSNNNNSSSKSKSSSHKEIKSEKPSSSYKESKFNSEKACSSQTNNEKGSSHKEGRTKSDKTSSLVKEKSRSDKSDRRSDHKKKSSSAHHKSHSSSHKEKKSHHHKENTEVIPDSQLRPDEKPATEASILISDSTSNDSFQYMDNDSPESFVAENGVNLSDSDTPSCSKLPDTEVMNWVSKLRSTQNELPPVKPMGKVRIAHVPNVSSLLNAKQQIKQVTSKPPQIKKTERNSWSLSKMSPSVVPKSQAEGQRPVVQTNLECSVPLAARQTALNNIMDEFLKFLSFDEASEKAVKEELDLSQKAKCSKTYKNLVVLSVLRIRKNKGNIPGDPKNPENIIMKSDSIMDFTYGATLYECFSKYLMTPEDFVLHGYPLELDEPGCAYIDKNSYYRSKFKQLSSEFRTCINCAQLYAVDDDGFPLTQNDCHHHWGKLYRTKRYNQHTQYYTCCNSEIGSDPCHVGQYHLTELKNEDRLEGFVKTRPYPPDADISKAGIFALDCEMCYSTQGLEVARCSLVSIDETDVYDVLIKPQHPILDYCTRFSGITEEKLANVTTRLKDVQKYLLSRISDKTILIGHSLENDLKALKLLHYTVIDTSILYPHRHGFPKKMALRTLASSFCDTVIQSGEHGHDSIEDSVSCLRLVLAKVKEDAKSRKPRVIKSVKP